MDVVKRIISKIMSRELTESVRNYRVRKIARKHAHQDVLRNKVAW